MPRRQCAKCPWKKSTDPHTIPDGYDVANPNAGQRIRAATFGVRAPTAAPPCPVDCFACGSSCTWREHLEVTADGASRWWEACCTRCPWTDRPRHDCDGEDLHPEG